MDDKELLQSIKRYGKRKVILSEDYRRIQDHITESMAKGIKPKITAPQQGWQDDFMMCGDSQLLVMHANRGGGKSFMAAYYLLQYITNPAFNCIVFRKSKVDQKKGQSIMQKFVEMYCPTFGTFNVTDSEIKGYNGFSIKFDYFGDDNDSGLQKFIDSMQGGSYCTVMCDEVSQLPYDKYQYLLSVLRSTTNIKPFFLGACNPDPDSFLKKMVFDGEWVNNDGLAIESESGRRKYYYITNGEYIFGRTKKEVAQKCFNIIKNESSTPSQIITLEDTFKFIRSATFVHTPLQGNKILLNADESYESSLSNSDKQLELINKYGSWATYTSTSDHIPNQAIEALFINEPDRTNTFKVASLDVAYSGDYSVLVLREGNHIVDIRWNKEDYNKMIRWVHATLNEWEVPENRFYYDGSGAPQLKSEFPRATAVLQQVVKETGRSKNEQSKFFFYNLKSQLAYYLSEKIKDGELTINPLLADKQYGNGTIKSTLLRQKKAIKFDERDDGKLAIIKKSVMKQILGNSESPDLIEAIIYGEMAFVAPRNNPLSNNIAKRLSCF